MASPDVDMGNYEDEIKNVFHVVGPSQRREVKRVLLNKAILSSTNLQMFLYYNFFYSLCYAWFFVLAFRWKYLNHSGLRVTFFTPIFFTIWALAEAARIWVGYQGNLREDTPNMAAFIFLTIFPQMLIIIYMLSMQVPLYGFDKIFNAIMLALLCIELLLAWRCLGLFIADKTARFSVEYGEVQEADGGVGGEEGQTTEVQAIQRYVEEGEEAILGGEQGGFDGIEMGPLSPARSRARPRPMTRGGELIAPSREGTTLLTPGAGVGVRTSFGGATAQPLAPYGGHLASSRSGAAVSARYGAAPAELELPPLAPLSSTVASRAEETPEERARRRAIDRAIISGRMLPPPRREDPAVATGALTTQEAAELAAAQAAAAAAASGDRLATTRGPVLTPGALASPKQPIRIPSRANIQPATSSSTFGSSLSPERQPLKEE